MRSEQNAMAKKVDWILGISLLTQLQWLFGNVYEEILTPNSIVASIPQINAYNRFFRITEPYFYYVPLTQLGAFSILFLALWSWTPDVIRSPLRKAAGAGCTAVALTVFIVTQYNLKMFFGTVDHLGAMVHQRYLEWALLNAVRVFLVATEVYFAWQAYRTLLMNRNTILC